MYIIFAQIIGFFGLAFRIMSLLLNRRRAILVMFMLSLLLYSLHLFLLGALTGAAMTLIGVARTYVFTKKKKQKTWKNFWLYFFLILFWIGGLLSWQNFYSVLPIIGMTLGTLSLWQTKPRNIRLFMLFAPPFWLIYNIIFQSYPGILIELVTFMTVFVGVIRYDILRNKKEVGPISHIANFFSRMLFG